MTTNRSFLQDLQLRDTSSGACYGPWINNPSGAMLESVSPVDGQLIGKVKQAGAEEYEKVVAAAHAAFETWRMRPAPQRGEIVRQIGDALRARKKPLGSLVSLEMGKIQAEGEGEVQEMIDICDFAVGLSRQLYGLTMHSERAKHRMYEQWHPLGVVGVITAFNFPVAVWAWNAALAMICGNTVVWKPSEKTPLTAVAVQNIVNEVLDRNGASGVCGLIVGDGKTVGEPMLHDKRVPLVSMTGSTAVGRHVGKTVAERFGRTILELGGNNALIVMDDANLDNAIRATLFGAVGTAGQRCTSTRRVLLHKGIAREFTERLLKAYKQVRIGSPLEAGTLMGPLIDRQAVDTMMAAIETAKKQGGEVLCGGHKLEGKGYEGGCYVEPTIIKAKPGMPILQHETFAPILYLVEVSSLEEAIQVQNDVPQGLSSSIFTNSMISAETFLSAMGSDCGIANVNIGTSGAEIGGAFGGEKETGGGRESGSDSWKAYMRRQTNTINWGRELPLAQGIKFGD
jgi:aldehyde dehydrogenase (NAD+)